MFFFKPTVDRALSALTKAVADLDAAIVHHKGEAERIGALADVFIALEGEQRDAMVRAQRTQAKLADLLA